MICAFFYWQLTIGWGWPVLVSMFVCLFVLAPAIGIVIEVAVMRRLGMHREIIADLQELAHRSSPPYADE